MQEFSIFHLFSGLGGGALGFQRAQDDYMGIAARFRTLGGVDSDADACRDFGTLTGVAASCLDLFAREDYVAFHGAEPPDDWHEAMPADLRRAAGNHRPDVIFTSPPCKGFSGLLPQASAASDKYQALNRLTVRGIALALAAWGDDLPGLIILENVPRITSRGMGLLTQIKALLTSAGYRLDATMHDLGEVGGLSQHRRRYLLVARHPAKVPAPLYVPPKRKVKAIGDALGPLPLPDAPEAGPLHRLPRLQWLTWVRLALIPAGGDWRDLQAIEPDTYRIIPQDTEESLALTDLRIPGNNDARHSNIYRVTSWDEAFGTVTSGKDQAIGDPRLSHACRSGAFKVTAWGDTANTVIGSGQLGGSSSVAAVADPRPPQRANRRSGQYAVYGWDDACGTVTGEDTVGSGAPSIADPRLPDARDTGSWVIMGADNTWHRPLTTLELAVLQGLPARLAAETPLTLAGRSQAKWRERIGNAVPVGAAEAVGRTMLMTLMAAQTNLLMLNVYATAVWVRNWSRKVWTRV